MNTSAPIAAKPSTAAATFAMPTTSTASGTVPPGAERFEHGSKPTAALCQPVFGMWRGRRDNAPLEHAGGLELAQPLGQRARGHALHRLPELVEPGRALERGPD